MFFGIPKKESTRKPKVEVKELHPDTAVLTMKAKPGEGKRTYRFRLNPKATSLLGLSLTGKETIAFAFIPQGEGDKCDTYIAVIADVPDTCTITKAGEFSSRPIHDYIATSNSLNQEIDNHFSLTKEEVNSQELFQLTLITEKDEKETVNESIGTLVE